ncbi:helix-turn-helix domain-containing protein [Pedococcus sp. 5OH_020]|uniref:helix-turn-helix domain-containing protein n=1 Tax=Pedococcus sp. 5OH_020 TaxID=2989814 RepID=UPI0022E99F02|nr:helix-turn-helix domain-containing protein [Pedococcus sp. 5OH_020]
MSNERMTAAVTRSGLTLEQLARKADVDPKTVQRWLAGRTPHPRHRYTIAALVGESEEFLWPGARRRPADALGAAAELVSAHPHRTDLNADRWWDFFKTAGAQIDLLGYTLYFLPHQHPQLVELLLDKCEQGCRVRVALADPQSEHVQRRDAEEHEAITLVPRIRSTLDAFQPLLDCPNADLRFQDAPLYNSVFRFDDQMLVTPHLYATPGRSAPLLHLRRLGPNGIFSRFSAHFEGIWSDSRPIDPDRPATPIRAGT